jgi:hypothetical protein
LLWRGGTLALEIGAPQSSEAIATGENRELMETRNGREGPETRHRGGAVCWPGAHGEVEQEYGKAG